MIRPNTFFDNTALYFECRINTQTHSFRLFYGDFEVKYFFKVL